MLMNSSEYLATIEQVKQEIKAAQYKAAVHVNTETSLDKGTQRKTTENELPSLTQCTA